MKTEFERVKERWEALAIMDPYYAVLSRNDRKNDGWLDHLPEFWASGQEEVSRLFTLLANYQAWGAMPSTDAVALDFGCGVGRLTFPLHARGFRVNAADVSSAMLIELSSRRPPHAEIWPVLIQGPSIALESGSVDLVYSNITLQHMAPELQKTYIREFCRVTKPGGWIVFCTPSAAHVEVHPPGNMNPVPVPEVLAILGDECSLVDVLVETTVGPGFTGQMYIARKK